MSVEKQKKQSRFEKFLDSQNTSTLHVDHCSVLGKIVILLSNYYFANPLVRGYLVTLGSSR